ncbi:MAG: hypothetical protein HUK22_08165 [Thermoguttaceae bacterium]|nr:hypothetical protein [Thermoguttaceae bacterium]
MQFHDSDYRKYRRRQLQPRNGHGYSGDCGGAGAFLLRAAAKKVFGDDSRFDLREPEPIEVPNDLALALDAPFWFEVVDAAGAKWYSKAGDFELVGGKIALVRQNAAGERAVFAASLDFPNGEAVDLAERRGAARLSVGVDGSVRGAAADGTPTGDALGTFRLVVFDNPARLSSRDGVFFAPTAESGPGRAAKIPGDSLVGVKSGRLILSNCRPEEIWARVEALLRAKRALSEI